MDSIKKLVLQNKIIDKIYLVRGHKVMLDRDLAEFYGVTTKAFNQAVKRQNKRFDPDFMFRLTAEEFSNLRSQIEVSSWGGVRYPPNAFTDLGVFMIAGVLNSDRAIEMHKEILRAFKRLNEILRTHKELEDKINDLDKKIDNRFGLVMDAIRKAMSEEISENKKSLGFKIDEVKEIDPDKPLFPKD